MAGRHRKEEVEPVLVSCIIPTFNRAALLKTAIESTLSQTYPHWELIIVDDGSTDQTEQVVRAYQAGEERIRYYKNPGKGGSAARNYGLLKSRGEYIAFMDDDDIHLPHRFESQLKAMQVSGARFLVSGYQLRNRDTDKVMAEHRLELKGKGAGFTQRWMVRKELLLAAGGFDEDYPSMQDIELSYKLAEHEVYTLHDDVVAALYVTPNSVSRTPVKSIRGKLMLLEKNADSMPPLEAAWWYFVVAIDCYGVGRMSAARRLFRKAARLDDRGIFSFGRWYFNLISLSGGLFKRLHMRLLFFLAHYKFPVLVNHPETPRTN